MLVYVKAQYSNGKVTKNMIGNLNTTNFIFTTDKNASFKINKTFDKYQYKGRLIFVNEDDKNPQEWVFTLMPTQKILDAFGITESEDSEESENNENNDEEEENEKEENNEKEESDSSYEESGEEEEYSEYSDED